MAPRVANLVPIFRRGFYRRIATMTFYLRWPPLLLRHLQHNRLAKRRAELPVVVLTSMKAAETDCYNAPLFHPSTIRYPVITTSISSGGSRSFQNVFRTGHALLRVTCPGLRLIALNMQLWPQLKAIRQSFNLQNLVEGFDTFHQVWWPHCV